MTATTQSANRREADIPAQSQRRSLQLLQIYRLIIALIFFSFNFIDTLDFIEAYSRQFFFIITAGYLTYTAISSVFSLVEKIPIPVQVHFHMLVDAIALSALMMNSGGIDGGLGTLLIVSVAASSLLASGRKALLYAAYATIGLLLQESYGTANGMIESTAYPQASLLGIAMFATAFLAVSLARRASESAALAERRGIDLANLAQLNVHLVNKMDSGIIVVDESGEIKLMNHAAKLLVKDGTPGQLLSVYYPPLQVLYKHWLKARDKNKMIHYTANLDLTDRENIRARFTRVGARKEDKGSVIYLQDMTELRQQVQESKLASLGRLTASIAHEIRNPLGAISHAAQLLSESEQLPKDDVRLTNIIQQQSLRLNKIIQDILRLSRREAPNTQDIDLNTWLPAFIQEFGQARGLPANWAAFQPDQAHAIVPFDPDHLQQILWNLCSNAKKYAHRTQMPIVSFSTSQASSRQILLEIEDYGPGIEPAAQEKLFEPFFTTSKTGTGLGLYISRELCLSNGGELSYVPVVSKHGCFRIRFPQS